MKEQLFLRFMAEDASVLWHISSDGSGQASGTAESLADLFRRKPDAQKLPVVVLLPGEKVLSLDVELPVRWSREVLVWAVEEQISSPTDTVFICPMSQRNDQGMVSVAVVDRALMTEWHKQLKSFGLKVIEMNADYLMLPLQSEQPSVLSDSDNLLIRYNNIQGMTIPENWWDQYQPLLEQRLLEQPLLEQKGYTAFNRINVSAHQHTALDNLKLLASHWRNAGISLLQGEFHLRKKSGLRRFAPALIMLAVALFIQTSMFTWNSIQLLNQKEQLDSEINQLFHQVMGPDARKVNPVQQFRNRLAELDSGSNASVLSRLNRLVSIWPEQGVIVSELSSRGDALTVTLKVDLKLWSQLESSLRADNRIVIRKVSQSTDKNSQQVMLEVRG